MWNKTVLRMLAVVNVPAPMSVCPSPLRRSTVFSCGGSELSSNASKTQGWEASEESGLVLPLAMMAWTWAPILCHQSHLVSRADKLLNTDTNIHGLTSWILYSRCIAGKNLLTIHRGIYRIHGTRKGICLTKCASSEGAAISSTQSGAKSRS